ncbi:GTP-binding protein [Tumebacillus sp. DT12]|uniref:GTP-binding protein n=1 Tax=Tumebacillus lacus TaxID=2995335 RepID=A0ABT3WZU7_9BACL|nr:GTP-binding protein [Tumebacillus lacus]MCX7570174.1 GTP-binding protein [Tumebacillus lacus]
MIENIDRRVPATLLTGALGSGKTTLLNRILKEQHGLKIGVIVNEFGELSIDHHLVMNTDEEVVELSNGCVCCSVRDDLLWAVTRMLLRPEKIDYLVVETTGLADPRPVAQTFLHEDLYDHVRLDSIITVVDAANFHENLLHSSTTLDQILAGDLILLNKIDLVEEKMRKEILEELEDINPAARVLESVSGEVDLRLLLDIDLHQNKIAAEPSADAPKGDFVSFDQLTASHLEREEISSISFAAEHPFDYEKLSEFLESLPRNIFRGKGILWIDSYEEQLIFHLVGDRSTATLGEPWGEKMRQSMLVLIGKGLDREALLAELDRCLDKGPRG